MISSVLDHPRVLALGLLLLAPSCKGAEVTQEKPAPAATIEAASASPPPIAAPAASAKTPVVPPRKEVAWALPKGALTDAEKPLVGTWAAKVGDDAIRSEAMSGMVMFSLGGSGGGIEGIAKAIQDNNRVKMSCIWMELFEGRTGIKRECALVNGEPSALDMANPLTGEKKDSGTKLEWYFDKGSKTVRIRFGADMLVKAVDAKTQVARDLRFRTWVLAFGKKSGEGFEMKESIPEHEYELPVQYVYEIFPGKFLGQ